MHCWELISDARHNIVLQFNIQYKLSQKYVLSVGSCGKRQAHRELDIIIFNPYLSYLQSWTLK